MKDYDVIVVGAGPAGSSAAKAAAEKGARTILLEEHTRIGHPQHCTGRLHGSKSGIGEEILATMDKRVIREEAKVRRIYSPSGRMMEISLEGRGVWLLDRALFDLQLAGQAARAGAEILLNTKVTGLLTHMDDIVGVKTNSRTTPEIHGKVVIAADGIKSLLGGIPTWARLAETGYEVLSGITWWLGNVMDVVPGVLELHLGSVGGKRGWLWLERCDSLTCLADFVSFEDFEKCRRGDSILSNKVRHAVPLQVTGWSHPLKLGRPLPKKVKSGLILTGAAAGYHPFLICLLSGRYAGETAADAVRHGDVDEERLAKTYDRSCESLKDPRKISFATFLNRSDDELEDFFDEMASMDVTEFDVLAL